jgi:DNA repair exonuclease SbcCD ATPase subunit
MSRAAKKARLLEEQIEQANGREVLQAEGEAGQCPICGRELGTVNVDKHHLVPKTHGGKEKFLIHKICHRKIHATFTEKELEKQYHTWAELLTHPEMKKFVAWVQKKPSDYYSGSDETQVRNGKRRR